jgi:hypothetical protein
VRIDNDADLSHSIRLQRHVLRPLSRISNGEGVNQANKLYSKRVTMDTGDTFEIDLQALPYPNDPSVTPDNVQVLTRLVCIAVSIPSDSAAKARLGGSTTDPWESWTSVAGSTWDVEDLDFKLNRGAIGFVVDATHRTLKVENVGSAGDIQIVILGS